MIWKDISPNFRLVEVFSPDAIAYPHLIDIPSLTKLNDFRDFLNCKLFCNQGTHKRRGVRSAREQMLLVSQGLSNAINSMHTAGKAFDLNSEKHAPKVLVQKARDFGWPCVIEYPTFVHVDNRARIDG